MSKVASFGAFRALATLMERAQIAARAGISFAGKRDLYAALGYQRSITPTEYRDRYRRNGIAARVVEAYPLATWRGGVELIEDEDPDTLTDFEEQWDLLQERLGVWAALCRADILAGLGRYAVVLIGAPGNLDAELPPRLKAEDVLYLAPYSEEDAKVEKVVEDPLNVRFGLPELYKFTRVGKGPKNVHWSRVLHVADGRLDERVYGMPRLERVWNWLDDLEKVTGGGSEAFWKRVDQGLIFNLDKDLELTPEDATKVQEAADELVHNMRRTMAVRGMEVQPLGSDVANFNNQVDAILTLISGATGIPKRILMGSERGELASTQDRENWEQRVTDRRTDFSGPSVVRPFVDTLIERGALPTPESYDVRWPEIESLTEQEQAAFADLWSKLNNQAQGVVVLPEEIRDRVLRLSPLPPEAIPVEEVSVQLNGAQLQQVAAIAKSVAAGELTPEQAVTMFEVLFGFSKEQATKMAGKLIAPAAPAPTAPVPKASAPPAGGAPPEGTKPSTEPPTEGEPESEGE